MVASITRETSIARVRVVRGLLGNRVEIARKLCGLRFGPDGPVAWDEPRGTGYWRKARASDMPELSVWLSEASK